MRNSQRCFCSEHEHTLLYPYLSHSLSSQPNTVSSQGKNPLCTRLLPLPYLTYLPTEYLPTLPYLPMYPPTLPTYLPTLPTLPTYPTYLPYLPYLTYLPTLPTYLPTLPTYLPTHLTYLPYLPTYRTYLPPKYLTSAPVQQTRCDMLCIILPLPLHPLPPD